MPQNRTSQNTTSARCLTARELEQTALQMRRAGNTYDQIAVRIGVSRQAAHKMVKKVLGRLQQQTSEEAEEVRLLELLRLDALQRGLWTKAVNGDPGAAAQILKIMPMRQKLFGLDPQLLQQKMKEIDVEVRNTISLIEKLKIREGFVQGYHVAKRQFGGKWSEVPANLISEKDPMGEATLAFMKMVQEQQLMKQHFPTENDDASDPEDGDSSDSEYSDLLNLEDTK